MTFALPSTVSPLEGPYASVVSLPPSNWRAKPPTSCRDGLSTQPVQWGLLIFHFPEISEQSRVCLYCPYVNKNGNLSLGLTMLLKA